MSFVHDLSALAARGNSDASGAWTQLIDLVERAASPSEVVQAAALMAQIGGMVLGRWAETAAALHRLHQHPAMTAANDALGERRSLWRAEAVMRHCSGDQLAAWDLLEKGIASVADRVRYDGLLAQTLAARGRIAEAIPVAARSATACAEVAADDPVMLQQGVIASNLAKAAQARIDEGRRLLAAAARLSAACDGRSADLAARRRCALLQVESQLAAGEPAKALVALRSVLAIEDQAAADGTARAATMALAAKAYAAKGDAAAAAKAEAASRELTARITRH